MRIKVAVVGMGLMGRRLYPYYVEPKASYVLMLSILLLLRFCYK